MSESGLYVDTSAMLKLYLPEPDAHIAKRLMSEANGLATSELTEVEVRRNLTARVKDENTLEQMRENFQADLGTIYVVELDTAIVHAAAAIAEQTLCPSLDAVHLASARRVSEDVTVLTFDREQAEAARAIGLATVGA